MKKCEKCGRDKRIDPTLMLMSMPPQPSYYCPECEPEKHERVMFNEQFYKHNKGE